MTTLIYEDVDVFKFLIEFKEIFPLHYATKMIFTLN